MEEVYVGVVRWCLYGLLGGFTALFTDFSITKRTAWVTYIKALLLLIVFTAAGYMGFVYGIIVLLDGLLVRYKNITLAEVLECKPRAQPNGHKCPTCGQRMYAPKE